jgi:hypothetical protein
MKKTLYGHASGKAGTPRRDDDALRPQWAQEYRGRAPDAPPRNLYGLDMQPYNCL